MPNNFKSDLKELLGVSAPIILEQIFVTLMGIVNVIMVSHVGENAVSGISMIDSISNIIIALFSALSTGSTILVAQSIGKKDIDEANKSAVNSIIMSTFISITILILLNIFKKTIISSIFYKANENIINNAYSYFKIIIFSYPILSMTQTIFGILRGTKNTRTPMFITILMNIFNVILGYLFIFEININIFFIKIHTQGLGVIGAALALSISRLLGLIIGVIYIIFYSKTIKINNNKYIKFNIRIQKKLLSLAIPTSLESGLFQMGRLITQIFIVSMGTASIFANSVAASNLNFLYVPGNAFSMGVMILVGQKVGRGEIDEISKTTKFAIKSGMILLGTLCLLFFPFTNSIAKIYNSTYESSIIIRNIMYSTYIALPLFWPLSFITPAALRATGDVKFTMLISIITMWLFRILLGWILGIILNLGILGVWFGMYIDWIVRGICFYIRLVRCGWKKKLI